MKLKNAALIATTLFLSTPHAHAESCFGPTAEAASPLAVEVTKNGEAIALDGIAWTDLDLIQVKFPEIHEQPNQDYLVAIQTGGARAGVFVKDLTRPVQPTPEVTQHLDNFKDLRTPECGACGGQRYFTISPGVYVQASAAANTDPSAPQDLTLTVQADRAHSEIRYTKDGAQFVVKYSMRWIPLPEYDDSCGCSVVADADFPSAAWLGAAMILLGLRRRQTFEQGAY